MTVLGSYKGSPTITLNPNDRFPFSFGVNKAKAILDNLDAIRAFVTLNAPKQTPAPVQAQATTTA